MKIWKDALTENTVEEDLDLLPKWFRQCRGRGHNTGIEKDEVEKNMIVACIDCNKAETIQLD